MGDLIPNQSQILDLGSRSRDSRFDIKLVRIFGRGFKENNRNNEKKEK